jgi:hypothetical protein
MATTSEVLRAITRALTASDEGAMWVTVEALVAKGTTRSLAAAVVLTLQYIEANRGSLDVAECSRILDRLEELISE